MSKLINIGQCALCNTQKELVNSHFIPKHTYRKMRDRVKPGYAVMLIDGEGNNSTSNQITQRLLCNDCEQLLRENGEDFYSKNGYWSDGQPPRILESIVKDLQKQNTRPASLAEIERHCCPMPSVHALDAVFKALNESSPTLTQPNLFTPFT